MPSATGLTGATGEYYVAAELSRRGWLATVTIKNSPGSDVLAQTLDRRRIVAIQTKTASPGTAAFTLGLKDERPGERDNEWYVFVALGDLSERADFYVVPRHVVAALAYLEHKEWMADRGRLHSRSRSGVRNENDRRSMKPSWIAGYSERWDLLEHSAWTVPYLGEPIFLDLASDFGLPSGCRPIKPPGSTRS